MTRDEMLALYGDVELRFSDYYKYTFNFCGKMNGHTVIACYGGDSDDIYREMVTTDEIRTLNKDQFRNIIINDKDNNNIYSEWSDY